MLSDGAFVSWTSGARLDSARLDARFYSPDHLRLLNRLEAADVPLETLGRLVVHLAHVTGYESSKHMDWVDDTAGVRVVEAQNVGDMLLTGTEWKLISSTGYAQLTRHQLQVGDLVFTKDGTLGNCAYVTERFLPAVASRHVFRIVPKCNVDGAYLTAWLCSLAGSIQTAHRQAGAVQGTIITPEVAQFSVLVPNRVIQRAIGNKVRKAERLREVAAIGRLRAMSRIDRLFGTLPAEGDYPQFGWQSRSTVNAGRIDAWFHQPFYVAMAERLETASGLRRVDLRTRRNSGQAEDLAAKYLRLFRDRGCRFSYGRGCRDLSPGERSALTCEVYGSRR